MKRRFCLASLFSGLLFVSSCSSSDAGHSGHSLPMDPLSHLDSVTHEHGASGEEPHNSEPRVFGGLGSNQLDAPSLTDPFILKDGKYQATLSCDTPNVFVVRLKSVATDEVVAHFASETDGARRIIRDFEVGDGLLSFDGPDVFEVTCFGNWVISIAKMVG